MNIILRKAPAAKAGPLTVHDIELVDADTGTSLKSIVRRANIRIEPDTAVVMEADLYLSFIDLPPIPAEWFIVDPRDQQRRKVRRIEFEDDAVEDLT